MIEEFFTIFKTQYPSANVLGFSPGYFAGPNERHQTISRIVALQPKVVVCGMGAKLQEQFLAELRARGWLGAGFTCGGFFHQAVRQKSVKYYPDVFDKLQLRWMYRIIDEPRLLRRYAIDYPLAFALIVADRLREIFTRRS